MNRINIDPIAIWMLFCWLRSKIVVEGHSEHACTVGSNARDFFSRENAHGGHAAGVWGCPLTFSKGQPVVMIELCNMDSVPP